MGICSACDQRFAEAQARGVDLDDLYSLGNLAQPQMGHIMFFTTDGRTALCAAMPRAGGQLPSLLGG